MWIITFPCPNNDGLAKVPLQLGMDEQFYPIVFLKPLLICDIIVMLVRLIFVAETDDRRLLGSVHVFANN